jgi:phosphonopyruvate decarboxylase
MADPRVLREALSTIGCHYVIGVPDSILSPLVSAILLSSEHPDGCVALHEGQAIAQAIGYHLGSGQLPVVYLQNSGLGNALNPLVSLADSSVYAIPMLLIVGWRGEPGLKDEPQHIKQGAITVPLLEALGIPFERLPKDNEAAVACLGRQAAAARRNSSPACVLVSANSIDTVTSPTVPLSRDVPLREDVIGAIRSFTTKRDVIVATTGVTSRELNEIQQEMRPDAQGHFLTVGGMGHASQIALGLAGAQPDRCVICLDGDGAILMQAGSLMRIGTSRCSNLRHIVFNNGAHESVGGAPTVATRIDLCRIAIACGYTVAECARTEEEFQRAFKRVYSAKGPTFLEIRIAVAHRRNLGRPVDTPITHKRTLMQTLGSIEGAPRPTDVKLPSLNRPQNAWVTASRS